MSDINPSATTAAQDSRTSIRLEAGLTAPDFTLPSDNGEHQFCTTYITDIFHFRRIVFNVVSASASRAGTASTHSLYDVLIRNFNVDCIINSFTHFLKRSF